MFRRFVTLASMSAILAASLALAPVLAPAAEAPYETMRNVTYVDRADGALQADIYRPHGDGPFPAVLVVHGGAWMSGNKNQLAAIAQRLAEKGYVAVAINYRLAPKHKFPAQIEDCRDALNWMRQNAQKYKIDPKRMGAWGYSAGGHLVALLGVTGAELKAVVAGGAPCDFRQIPPNVQALAYWLGGTRANLPEVYKTASPAAFVSPKCPPVFFYHGENDALAPLAGPKAMAELLKQAKVEASVHIVPEAGHIAAFLNREGVTKGMGFLEQHLKTRPPAPPGKGRQS